MRYIASFLLTVFFFVGVTQKLAAQVNLAELKKQEAERRKNTEKSKIKVSDSNLQRSGGGAKSTFVQVQTAGAAEEPPPEKSAASTEAEKQMQEEYWRGQKTQLETRIQELEAAIQRDESEVNKLWTDFYIQNDPIIQANIKAQLSRVTNQLESNRQSLRQVRGELDALAERARKAGVPPGWLR